MVATSNSFLFKTILGLSKYFWWVELKVTVGRGIHSDGYS